jgi:hypothetical protein
LVDPLGDHLFVRYRAAKVLMALCDYLIDTPQALLGLGDPLLCSQMIMALRDKHLKGPPRHEVRIAMSPRGDVRDVMASVAEEGMRLYRGRPIEGEPVLSAKELAERTKPHLPRTADPRYVTSEALQSLATDWVSRTPWPFSILLGDGKSS